MFNLELLKQELVTSNGLRSVFTLLFVATVLTIYEFVVFYYVIVPSVKVQIDSALKQAGEAINNTLYDILKISDQEKNLIKSTQTYTQTEQEIESIIQVFKDRENLKLNKINNYTIATGALILGGLVLILYIIKHTLNSRGTTIGICTWLTIAITIGLLAIFQYNFYTYGNKYKYIGSFGDQELIAFLYTNMNTERPNTLNEPDTKTKLYDKHVLQEFEKSLESQKLQKSQQLLESQANKKSLDIQKNNTSLINYFKMLNGQVVDQVESTK